jgi:hypothetical protein
MEIRKPARADRIRGAELVLCAVSVIGNGQAASCSSSCLVLVRFGVFTWGELAIGMSWREDMGSDTCWWKNVSSLRDRLFWKEVSVL